MAQRIIATTLVHLMLYIMITVLPMRLLIHSVVIAHTTMSYNALEGNAVSYKFIMCVYDHISLSQFVVGGFSYTTVLIHHLPVLIQ